MKLYENICGATCISDALFLIDPPLQVYIEQGECHSPEAQVITEELTVKLKKGE